MDNEKMTENISNEVSKTEPTDIFQWANLTDGIKNELDVEFFLFNKNFMPFTTSFTSELNAQIKPLFIFGSCFVTSSLLTTNFYF